MKFAKIVFWIGGGFGLLASVGLYFGEGTPLFYGLIAAVLAANAGFCIIAMDPQRYRLMMIPAMIEKFVWVATLLLLYFRGRMSGTDVAGGIIPHGLLGILFVAAFAKTPRATL